MCNFNVRFFIQVFFEVCVCCFINLARMSSESSWSSFFSIVYLLTIIAFTVFVISRLKYGKPEWDKYEETISNPRYKTIYLGLYMKYHYIATMYPVLYLLRRILYAMIIVTMTGHPTGQVFLYTIMSCGMLLLLW